MPKYGSVVVLERHKVFDIYEGMSLIGKPYKYNGYPVETSKDRLMTFKHKGIICAGCGVVASFFAIETVSSAHYSGYALNLYGISDGKELYFTKDHIVPKSKGGPDTIDNYQTMCWDCNNKKGNIWEPGEKVKEQ